MSRTLLRVLIVVLAPLATIPLGGCDEDERLTRMATEAADRQAAQNQEMSRLNREVAEGTKRLVEANAQTQKELAALQHDLQADQAEIGRQRDLLETERKQVAAARRRDPIIANAITGVGLALACMLPLLLCWYLLRSVRDETDDTLVAEVLIQELASDTPRLLPPFEEHRTSLPCDRPPRPSLTAVVDSDVDEASQK